MAQYDSAIRISTKVDTSQMQKINVQIEKASAKVRGLESEMKKLSLQKGTDSEIRMLNADINELTAKIKELESEKARLEEKPMLNASEIKRVSAEIEQLKVFLAEARAESESMAAANAKFASIAESYAIARDELGVLVNRQEELHNKQNKTTKSTFNLVGAFKRMGEVGKSALAKLSGGFSSSDNALSRFTKRIWGLAKRVFVFSIFLRAFRSMVNGIKEGFQNLAKYDDNFNREMSRLKSSCAQLKNAIAGAFAPLVTAAIPYLTEFISKLISACNVLAQFIATMTGQGTWIKATEQQIDYADSLDKTAGAAKKARKELAQFDTLEVLNKKESGGAGGVGTAGSSVQNNPLALPSASQMGRNFADWLKKSLESIPWAQIKAAAEQVGRNLAQFFNSVWEYIDLARDLGMTIGEALNTAVNFVYGIVDETKWDELGSFFGTMVQAAFDTFDEEKAGRTVGKAMNGIATAILNFFSEDGDGYKPGTLGAEIAGLINAAIDEIQADLIGNALGTVLFGVFSEIDTFFTDTHFNEIGEKLTKVIAEFFGYTNSKDVSLGQRVGQAIADCINAASELLNGTAQNYPDIIGNLTNFLLDLIIEALKNIDAETVINKLAEVTQKVSEGLDELGESAKKNIAETILPDDVADGYIDFSHVIEGITGKLGDAIGKTSGFGEAISKVENAKGVYDTVKDSIELMTNKTDTANEKMNKFVDIFSNAPLSGKMSVFRDIAVKALDDISQKTESTIIVEEGFVGMEEAFSQRGSSAVKTGVLVKNEALDSYADKAEETGEKVGTFFTDTEEAHSTFWSNFNKEWTTNIENWQSTMVEPYFSVEKWKEYGENMKVGLINGFKVLVSEIGGIMNKVIDIFNNALKSIEKAINDLVDDFNKIASQLGVSGLKHVNAKPISHVGIPALADGAVIRGGNPFLAILGDQKSGQTNIETPLDTMVQAFKMATANNNSVGNMTVNLNVDGQKFARLTLDDFMGEIERRGGVDVDLTALMGV